VRDGRVKALAVSTAKRSPALPQVPSMAESGFADFDVLNYFGLVAPKGTPDAVIERLSDAVAKVVNCRMYWHVFSWTPSSPQPRARKRWAGF
jgi:tripartite-type tricarboxylate transporter receptor subunit TctC